MSKMSEMKVKPKSMMEIILKNKESKDNAQAIEAATKLASVSSEAVISREIMKDDTLPMILHIVQDHPLVTRKVTLALLQVLLDLAPSVPHAEAIMEAWSVSKV